MLLRKVFLLTTLLLYSAFSLADQFCFSIAESYYEQIYCEVKASGKGKDLPAFYDFKRNDERMQGLLLKRYAQRIGINLKLVAVNSQAVNAVTFRTETLSDDSLLSACHRDGNAFQCEGAFYRLLGNTPNNRLSEYVLSENNTMRLPLYKGALSDPGELSTYLRHSYLQYLRKMIDIGLGGATLSYGKFAFLFNDLNNKGVSFVDRFETMYRYLKKDKRALSVPSKSVAPAELSIKDCYRLEELLVCRTGRHNWLFRK